ncbi:hypothetical protein [Sphaerisporangium fuscum]|uniref:hypothetical protein n=1 Tax=Sphaerisporangium fuscum TaxID=2835868 RepID=UPI001BDCF220|nr:hypothetical protein [Sphaerisporangium fuscum]
MTGPDEHGPGAIERADEDGVLWTWAADDFAGRGVLGVTTTRLRARLALLEALGTMPERGHGTIRPAELDIYAHPYPCYRYGPVVMHARRDRNSGVIVIAEGTCP